MCESNLIVDNEFNPIDIYSNNMQLIYIDAYGKKHVLLKHFKMGITITKADCWEQRDKENAIISYQFNLYK